MRCRKEKDLDEGTVSRVWQNQCRKREIPELSKTRRDWRGGSGRKAITRLGPCSVPRTDIRSCVWWQSQQWGSREREVDLRASEEPVSKIGSGVGSGLGLERCTVLAI